MPDASTLPPLDSKDSMDSDYHDVIRRRSGWNPGLAIGAIFIGSFIIGVLLTAAILAGYIEIQPSVIKGFFKAILGKH